MNADQKASDHKALAAQIRNTASETDLLLKRVLDKLDSPEEDSKRIPFYFTQPISFLPAEMTLRESTYVNGAEDVSIVAMTYNVETSGPPNLGGGGPIVQAPNVVSYLSQQHLSNSRVMLWDNRFPIGFSFDFEWNFRTKQGNTYLGGGSVGPGSSFLAHRTALGFPEQGNILRFNRPQVVKAGESLIFSAKPLFWQPFLAADSMSTFLSDANLAGIRVIINFTCIGFRDGRMAWPTVRS